MRLKHRVCLSGSLGVTPEVNHAGGMPSRKTSAPSTKTLYKALIFSDTLFYNACSDCDRLARVHPVPKRHAERAKKVTVQAFAESGEM